MNQTALITGASGGLGLELARVMAENGFDLVLTARSEDKLLDIKRELEQEYKVSAAVFACDLTQHDAAQQLFDYTEREGMRIDVLVNNAGFGDFGLYAESSWDKQNSMIQLNVVALAHLTHLFVQPMIKHSAGKILNIASIAAFQPGPLMSVYYATKAFVLSLSEALSVELKDTGVTVTAVCPGPIRTGFEQQADLGNSGLFKNLSVSNAADVARFAYGKLMQGKTVAVYGAGNKFIVFGAKLAPRSMVRNTVYKIQKEQ